MDVLTGCEFPLLFSLEIQVSSEEFASCWSARKETCHVKICNFIPCSISPKTSNSSWKEWELKESSVYRTPIKPDRKIKAEKSLLFEGWKYEKILLSKRWSKARNISHINEFLQERFRIRRCYITTEANRKTHVHVLPNCSILERTHHLNGYFGSSFVARSVIHIGEATASNANSKLVILKGIFSINEERKFKISYKMNSLKKTFIKSIYLKISHIQTHSRSWIEHHTSTSILNP